MRKILDRAGKVYHVVRRIAEEKPLDGTEVERFLQATKGFEEESEKAKKKVILLRK
jgi:hypothetical protein